VLLSCRQMAGSKARRRSGAALREATTAQAVAQLARSANETPTVTLIDTFAVSDERAGVSAGEMGADAAAGGTDGGRPLAELVARLAGADDARSLSGAELVMRAHWVGLRTHPAPRGSVSFGGPAIPDWVQDGLREIIAPE
jgi:hypothetical protein